MIVDCHTHIWQNPDQLGQMALGDPGQPRRARATRVSTDRANWRLNPPGDCDNHWAQASASKVDKTFVLAFKSRYLHAEIPNSYVAEYVNRYPDRLIGFAGIDPAEPSALDDIHIAHDELKMRGITLSPANQDFHPSNSRVQKVYAAAEELDMPILVHPGSMFTEQSKLEFAHPYLWDEVARNFPGLRIVLAQLGQPWVEETICLLGKHPNVFADVSGLMKRPWQGYNALVSAFQYGVMEKLLFGSDFPYTSATECIETLYSINQFAQGTNLPTIPRESLRGIVERDTLSLLGLD